MNNKAKTPPKWTDVYPQGSKQGDEEQGFFIAISRSLKWQWRSTAQISKESNLSKERVDEILNKYWKKGMVFQNPANEDQWGYWERCPEMLSVKEDSITTEDHNDRIGKDLIKKVFGP